MTTAVIVKRGMSIQESADDDHESIRAALCRIKALHPSAFRDRNVTASFVTLDDAQRVVGEPRPIDLAEFLPAA